MGEAYAEPAMARYRDNVTDLMAAGEPFGNVEEAIDGVADLTEDAKAALWLLASALRDQRKHARDARAYVVAVG